MIIKNRRVRDPKISLVISIFYYNRPRYKQYILITLRKKKIIMNTTLKKKKKKKGKKVRKRDTDRKHRLEMEQELG